MCLRSLCANQPLSTSHDHANIMISIAVFGVFTLDGIGSGVAFVYNSTYDSLLRRSSYLCLVFFSCSVYES